MIEGLEYSIDSESSCNSLIIELSGHTFTFMSEDGEISSEELCHWFKEVVYRVYMNS